MAAIEIDPGKLPQRALLDTGVVIRALGDRPGDTSSQACEAFWSAMLENDRQIVIASPTIAEMIRQDGGKRGIPRRRGVEVVAFDDRAAELLGLALPFAVLQATIKATGLPKDYIKYDALIAACAKRYRATHIIALDGDYTGLAAKLALLCKKPEDFAKPQGVLPGVT